MIEGTGLTYDDLRAMPCPVFWRRYFARNRWERAKMPEEEKAGEDMDPEDFRSLRGKVG